MVRLRNAVTGVMVRVSEEKAGRLVGFEPVVKSSPKKAPAKKSEPDEK